MKRLSRKELIVRLDERIQSLAKREGIALYEEEKQLIEGAIIELENLVERLEKGEI